MNFLRNLLEEGTSFPEISYPSLRKGTLGSPDEWVQGKVIDDGAEGLWRVNNSLYDFSDFVKRHPGGEAWLTITKVCSLVNIVKLCSFDLFVSFNLRERI